MQTLTFYVQCVEDIIPDLGTLLNSMKDYDSPHQPSAAAALSQYEELCSFLSTDDMHREVKMLRWDHGRDIHFHSTL